MSSSQRPGGSQRPEYLEQGTGAPLADREPRSGGSGGRRTAAIATAGVLGLGVLGVGAWSAMSFFATGAQPAEALPGSTLGYVSIDLDPGGAQKIEAMRTLRKFPAFREHVGLQADDDVRRRIFEEIRKGGQCEGVDYGDDIEPWLGDRAAVAAVETGGQQPTPVLVVQVTDEGAAEEGLTALARCAVNATGGAGWAISDGWAVLAETDKVAERVVADADAAPLSEDAEFQGWSDEVGDPGIVSMYAAPEAGAYLAENLDGMAGLGTQGAAMTPAGSESQALEDFKGAAATLRFEDGTLELELAADAAATGKGAYAGDRGDDVLATLPADTAAALGVGFSEGWFTDVAEQLASYSGGVMSSEELLAMLSEQSGLDLPADAETLAGQSMAVGLGGDVDPEALINSADGSDVPVAAKVRGDVEAIESVLDKVRGRMAPGATTIDSASRGDVVVVGPNPSYRQRVLQDGGLGKAETFTDVVPNAAEASIVFFLDFDAGDNWLAKLAVGDQRVADNLEPLRGLGMSAWQEEGAGHALVRLTTD